MTKEISELYRNNDRLQSSLNYIHQNYDLDSIEEKFNSAKKTETWAEAYMNDLNRYFNVVENFARCGICQKTIKRGEIEKPVMVLPCQHFFCGSCHIAKKTKIKECNSCGKHEEKVVVNTFLENFLDQLSYFKEPLDERANWMKIRIERKFIV